MTRSDPFATRLVLLTGKGGVGKTTVAAALALEAARQGRRALVVELGHRASLTALFEVPIGHAPVEIAARVSATNVDLDQALQDYVSDHVPVPRLARRIATSRSLARFFEAAPAVSEVLTLHRLEQLLQGPWDHVIVDLDATGHALMFLELPRVFEQLVPSGPVRRLLDSFSALLSDPRRTVLHLVTLPGRLPLQETTELYARLAREHSVRLGTVFANRVPPRPLTAEAEATLPAWHARLPEGGAAREDLALLVRDVERHRRARAQLDRFASALPLPLVELPEHAGLVGRAALSALGQLAGARR